MAIFVLGANPFKGETSAPTKLLAGYSGWSAHEFQPGNVHPERSDILDHFLPQWKTLKEQLRKGDTALWNPVSVSGRPGILELSRGTLTPSFLAFALIDNDALGFYVATLIKIFIAAFGGYILLRLFITPQAAFFGGLIYSLCGFNAAWLYWPQVSTSAWIPWVLWATAGWCIYRKSYWLMLVILTIMMLIIGGFPAVAAYGLYAAIMLFFMLEISQSSSIVEKTKHFGGYLSAIIIAFMLTAIPLLALLELINLIDMGYRTGGTALKPLKDISLFINPFLYDIPRVERTFYVGILPIIITVIACLLLLKNRTLLTRNQQIIFIYSLILFMISLSIAFALIPREIISQIPAIGSSPWSRLVVLIDLSLALMAAIGLHLLLSIARKYNLFKKTSYALPVLFTCLIIFQYKDQLHVFRSFNTVSDYDDFFPETPELNFIKSNIGKNLGVIVDKNFFISGTVGYYGLREWFAHDFRTEIEKNKLSQLIKDPFVTATASIISSHNINQNADLLASFGVKFVVRAKEQLIHKQRHNNNKPWPILLDQPLTQWFFTDERFLLSAVGVIFATYGAQHSPSDVYLILRDANGAELARAEIPAEDIKDNKNAIFKLIQPVELEAGTYSFEVGALSSLENGKLAVWYSQSSDNFKDKLTTKGHEISASTLYSLYASTKNKSDCQWKVHEFSDNDLIVLENKLIEKGVYFVSENLSSIDWNNQNLTIKSFSPSEIVIDNKMDGEGYLVLPMRYYPGWSAYVDGKEIKVETFMEMLPAIPVSSPSEVRYQYNPQYLITGAYIMSLGLISLVVLKYVYRRKRPKKI